MHILIADSDHTTVALVKKHLEDRGNLVRVAGNIEQGLSEIASRPFDVVICDYLLDQAQTCEPFVSKIGHSNLILVTATNRRHYPDAILMQETGARAVLRKPIRLEDMDRIL